MRQKLVESLTRTEGATETRGIPHQDRGCKGNSCNPSPGQRVQQKLVQSLTRTEGATETHVKSHQDRGCEENSCSISPGQTDRDTGSEVELQGNEEGERLEGSYFYCEAL